MSITSGKLGASVRKFKKFQGKAPHLKRHVFIDTKTPLIEIGPVPVITYISEKEGEQQAYFHETNPEKMPKLFAHPKGEFFLIIGGTVKIDEWLED